MSTTPYQASGFRLDGVLESGDTFVGTVKSGITIAKGDALHDDGNGFVTNTVTAFAATFMGIAAEPAASLTAVIVIRPNPKLSFWVPNASATVAAQTDIGETLDLGGSVATKVDVTDNAVVEWGLRVVEIDITAAALAANAGGYVRGFFEKQPQ